MTMMKRDAHRVVGVDLAGSEKRRTGLCFMKGLSIETKVVYGDEGILDEIGKFGKSLVAIDAPLSIPKGRRSLEDRRGPHLRSCDRMLLDRRIRVFPVTLGPMRKLTERGIRIKGILEKRGCDVIEVYPGGAQDVLRVPRKSNLKGLIEGLKRFRLKGLREDDITHDEIDAVTAAVVGMLYILDIYEPYGDPEEGVIIMPCTSSADFLERTC